MILQQTTQAPHVNSAVEDPVDQALESLLSSKSAVTAEHEVLAEKTLRDLDKLCKWRGISAEEVFLLAFEKLVHAAGVAEVRPQLALIGFSSGQGPTADADGEGMVRRLCEIKGSVAIEDLSPVDFNLSKIITEEV